MPPRVTWSQALAFRMQRHLLDPIGGLPITGVVHRLCGVQAQVASSAELAIRIRQRTSRRGEVDRALASGRLIRTWAMRGTLHLLVPDEAGAFLSLLAAARSWERPSWQRTFGVTPPQMELLREAVGDALRGPALTREELEAAVTRRRGLAHVGEALRSGWGAVLKPLAWQGDLCFGPTRDGRVTFTRPESASPRWRPLPHPDEAGPSAIAAYLAAHGPATLDAFGAWLARGRFSKRQLRTWAEALGDRLVEVGVDGVAAYVLGDDLDDLASATPTRSARLLPGFDQYVLGPGTGDPHVVPPGRRGGVSRQSGWISPVVVVGGVVCGTWELEEDRVLVSWFDEAGRLPRRAIHDEVERLETILGGELHPTVTNI